MTYSKYTTKENVAIVPIPSDPRFRNLNDQRFGRLLVLGFAGRDTFHKPFWWCECDCGNITKVYSHSLGKYTNSCGCLNKEDTRTRSTTHGKTKSRVYNIWAKMISRCTKESTINYERYGGRGITVCPEWLTFENFYQDMGEPPTKKHSIERIDNDGNYTLENCKWATDVEQANNKCSNRNLTARGKTQSIAKWAQELGVLDFTLYMRRRSGWSDERIVNTPVRRHSNQFLSLADFSPESSSVPT